MQYNFVGKTGIRLSVVGFGTAQLRMLPEQKAIDTLCRGFELGVNWVHTATDYGGAESIIAKAIMEFGGGEIHVISNAPGPIETYKSAFENTCRILGKNQLPLFGISGIDYCEDLGHNIWDKGGMLDFLQQMKKSNRLGGIYCSTHGSPDYIAKLITSGYFDALMISYNPLGFHVLTYYGKSEGKAYEEIDQASNQIFPLALKHNVSLLIMKPLAGGLICSSKAFPPHERFSDDTDELKASDILKAILQHKAVCAVVPGTASVEEAEENASAGYNPYDLTHKQIALIEKNIFKMQHSLCSRCGSCEITCSRSLPISWLFREGYIWNYPADTFEALGRLHYFKLHPGEDLLCNTCTERTCVCQSGIDIPKSLNRVHNRMLILRKNKFLHATPEELETAIVSGNLPSRVVCREMPADLKPGQIALFRFWVENVGPMQWLSFDIHPEAEKSVALIILLNNQKIACLPINHDLIPGQRIHFTFELQAPIKPGEHTLSLILTEINRSETLLESTELMSESIYVDGKIPYSELLKLYLQTQLTMVKKKSIIFQDKITSKILEKVNSLNPYLNINKQHEGNNQQMQTLKEPENSYGVDYLNHNIPEILPAKSVYPAKILIKNTGDMVWHTGTPDGENVAFYVRYNNAIISTHLLPRSDVHSGEEVTLRFTMNIPSEPGRMTIMIELVQFQVALFTDKGVQPLAIELTIDKPVDDPHDNLWNIALHHNPWHFQPTRGVSRGTDGRRYPIIAHRAEGGHLWDITGNKYLDFIMGWGSTLLGYADKRVQQAIIEAVQLTAPVIPYVHPYEIEVTQMLCEDIPSAEMAIFGKNGSDVCTVAARIARVLTGKKTILYSGYHGWQDWWVEQMGFHRTGVPDRSTPLIHRFRFNDINDFYQLYEKHKHDLAAVMLEPSGPLGEDEIGIKPDEHTGFLREIASATKRADAILVFDEIFTGYRYPGGSVQKATGVIPDMTCLGKALASGMPLAALVGQADILKEGMYRTKYAPTFKSEIYSFAAARAAIKIYREEPVAEYVWSYGLKLKKGINELCRQYGVNAACIGTPCRMIQVFIDSNHERLMLKKTLYFQELLARGLCSYNCIMIPSYAHTEEDLAYALSTISTALEIVADADSKGELDKRVEIPILVDFE